MSLIVKFILTYPVYKKLQKGEMAKTLVSPNSKHNGRIIRSEVDRRWFILFGNLIEKKIYGEKNKNSSKVIKVVSGNKIEELSHL